jgi:soluble lytic murein transglycosylase-like protein
MSQTTALPHPAARLADLVVHFLHGSLLSIGLAVSLLMAGVLIAGELPVAVQNLLASYSNETAEAGMPVETDGATLNRNMQLAAEVIAKRYRVARPAIEDIVRTAEQSARTVGLDPLLVLAVIGIESRFNPYSESAFGAQGLMQIIGKFHTDKFEPTPDGLALLDPATNIRVGVQILNEYQRSSGSVETALKRYGGESEVSGFGYAERVLAEKNRLEQLLLKAARRS